MLVLPILLKGYALFYSLYLDHCFRWELDNFSHSLLKVLAGYAASFSSYIDYQFSF